MDFPQVVLINPLESASGGSERRTLELARLLSTRAAVTLCAPDPARVLALAGQALAGIRVAAPRQQTPELLRGAIVLVVGFYFDLPEWMVGSDPDRLILIVNLDPQIPQFRTMLSRLLPLRCGLELHFASQWIAAAARLPGRVVTSPIDLNRFHPIGHSAVPQAGRPFHVGRLSRDAYGKHHPGDPALYNQLLERGCRVTVMGGTVLSDPVGPAAAAVAASPGSQAGSARIQLLPAGHQDAAAFLRDLDCFVYRTHPGWREPSGRVIHEAMATGLPVVAHRSGGYSDVIQHARNGFLFDSDTEALHWIEQLRLNADLRGDIGLEARRSMERMHGPEARERLAELYLNGAAHPTHRLHLP